MFELDRARLEDAANAACEDGARAAAGALLEALDGAPCGEDAVRATFATLLGAISQNYFGQEWAAEHEFSVWARLTDDPRAWGYGSEDELAGLRWLVDLTDRWFDGKELLPVHAWLPRFEAWANEQRAMVKRVTPGALDPDARLRLGE